MYTATRSVDDDGHDDGDGGGTIFVPQYDRTGDSSRGSSFDVWLETEDEDDRIGIGGAGVSSIRTGGSPSLSRGSHLPPPPTTTTLFSLPPLPPPPAHTPPQPNHLSNAIHHPKKQSPCSSVPKRKRPVKVDVSLSICTRLWIATQDTSEAGFLIEPKEGEDRIDSWTIRLFQFDEDLK